MASCNSLLSEEQFLCSICLDVFTRPVSTPCGHNFCMSCITVYWDDKSVCQCPLCKETFARRPDLKVNTFISELASQFVSLQVTEAQMWTPVQQQVGCGGVVLCDICTDTEETAVKSCLECLTSYCAVHLEPHYRAAGLKRHTLVEPVAGLEDRLCKEHARLLTLFCKGDDILLCDVCSSLNHRKHNVVSLPRAYEEAKDQLEEGEVKVQQMIEKNMQEVHAMKESVEKSKKDTKDVIAESTQVLMELVSEVQESQKELVQVIEERQKAAEEEADGFVSSVEQELKDLQSTAMKLSELKQTEDPLSFLLSVPKMSFRSHTIDLLTFSFDRYVDNHRIRRCLSKNVPQLQKLLHEMNTEIKQILGSRDEPSDNYLKFMRQYVEDILLDPETAHPLLVVSDDRKQVRFNMGLASRGHPSPKVFTAHLAVLGATALSTYKFYFEVFVGGKTEWCLGMAKESIQRRGQIPRRPGCGLWAIWFIEDRFETFCRPNVPIHFGKVERVGVFVMYETDEIIFYDVQNLKKMYTFTDCSFTEKLYPYLNPCDNEYSSNLDPMIIVPVKRWRW
uniref:E3 ubiquitin-protein ligase TRIM39-like n=1 Tax=Semicossyphus pulcher TaxID=241346 RepID=UPI0037E78AF2